MEIREAPWPKRWQRDTPDSVALFAELDSLRAQAIAEDVPLLDPEELDQTLAPGAHKHAPADSKQEFCLILDSIIRIGVLPWGVLYVIIALLPKEGAALGMERPIGLLPIPVRILDRLFHIELSAWCDAAHGFWDRARARSSASRQQSHDGDSTYHGRHCWHSFH